MRFSWIYVFLATDQREGAEKGPPGILGYISVQNLACREETERKERVHGKEEQTNSGEEDTETEEQAVKKTTIKERSL
ncbi:hypothetical protein llap_12504 [Limosa lapponica baueri]|uniref:Uncharacterized protein n=1 Tax=Limosa lapponica baueri TaxID=1758121 RepID=A0A2I0TTS1_LIMLA|nr:hypothetical protein llap_12504 [Limosa lapponica baueri]